MLSVARDFRARYTGFESFVHDRLIAPALIGLTSQFEAEMLALPPANGELLDVGCGGGHLLAHIAQRRHDLRLCGVDISVEQVRRARERTSRFGQRARILEGSALELPFADRCFDVVLSVASIKHWPDPRRGLAECARVLKPGGLLLVVEADRGCRLDDARRFVRRWHVPAWLQPVALALFRTYVAGQSLDLDDLRALAADLPLTERRIERIGGTPGLALRAVRAQTG